MFRSLLLFSVMLALGNAKATTPEEYTPEPYVLPRAPDEKAWPRKRLIAFMHELADFVYAHHVVTDPQRKTYGMVYEFWQDGKQIQEFGLDSMHDGAWFLSAMLTAHRADPSGGWLERAQQFQVPFYTNLLLNSDRLFPQMQPTEEDEQPWSAPLKGWAPRGWDDGHGIDRKTGQPLAESNFTSSNHLAQDLADALLDVWLSTRDPQVAAALRALDESKRQTFGPIQGLEIGAAVSAGRADAFLRYKLPDFSPEAMNSYFAGLYQQKGSRLPTYDDGLAWMYRQATAGAQICGEFPRAFAAHALARCHGYQAAIEAFFDEPRYEYGIFFFDLQRTPGFIEGTGKLENYSSASRNFYGARGIEIAWAAASLLPELKERPELWDGNVPAKSAAEPRVPIIDESPVIDGKRDATYVKLEGTNGEDIALLSDPRNLHIHVQSSKPEVTLSFQHAGPVSGEARIGRVTLKMDGTVIVVNDKGARLLAASAFVAGEPWNAELSIPYSIVPAQAQWINGVDHGRYLVTCNGGKAQTVYFLSSSARILQRLEHLVLGTIDYWHGVWKSAGVIPSGWSTPTAKAGPWEISDAGNYAHLIKAIAFWLIYTEGKREWMIIREDFPKQPRPAPPLPASVLKAQGLE